MADQRNPDFWLTEPKRHGVAPIRKPYNLALRRHQFAETALSAETDFSARGRAGREYLVILPAPNFGH